MFTGRGRTALPPNYGFTAVATLKSGGSNVAAAAEPFPATAQSCLSPWCPSPKSLIFFWRVNHTHSWVCHHIVLAYIGVHTTKSVFLKFHYFIVFRAGTEPILLYRLKRPLNSMHTTKQCSAHISYTRLIPGLLPANERRRYKVTPSLIGWAQT